jgi:uroporphyrinogen decarboxylase
MPRIIPTDPDEVRVLLEERYGKPERDRMTPRKRVATALDLKQPDRVPFDFWAVPETLDHLQRYLCAADEEEILQLLGVDCRIIEPDYVGPEPERFPDGTFYGNWGSHRRIVENAYSRYEEYASFPLAAARTRAEVETWPRWPKPEYFSWEHLVERIQRVNARVPYHIRVDVSGVFESAWGLYGLDHFLTGLYDHPEVPSAIMDCYTDLMIGNVHRMMAAGQGLIDWVYTFDDVAVQNGLMMSPAMWREFILPRHLRLNQAIKEYGVKILYHSCGAIYPLIKPLVEEMGIDALNPLQPRARWMDMAKIKREFGGKIAFHGGIDLQETLPRGTPEEVTAEVRERCRVLGKGGGYICTSAHYIQADVPVENIIAMYLAPREVDPLDSVHAQ